MTRRLPITHLTSTLLAIGFILQCVGGRSTLSAISLRNIVVRCTPLRTGSCLGRAQDHALRDLH